MSRARINGLVARAAKCSDFTIMYYTYTKKTNITDYNLQITVELVGRA